MVYTSVKAILLSWHSHAVDKRGKSCECWSSLLVLDNWKERNRRDLIILNFQIKS